jgi:diguanylate cyclase (GGDEF)-like protein/PAS domain S-box-containing protein
VQGAYPVAEKIPAHLELAKEFGVAPFTVRQVLAHLEREGLVSVEQGRGTFVRAVPDGAGAGDASITGQGTDGRDHDGGRRSDRALSRLEALQEISSALSPALTQETVARLITEKAVGVAGASAGTVLLLNATGTMLEQLCAIGYSSDVIDRYEKISVTDSLPVAEAVQTGEVVWIESKDAWRRIYKGRHDELGSSSEAIVAIPLIIEHTTIGGLVLRFTQKKKLEEDERSFLVALSQQCALAIDRARLFESKSRLAAIVESSDDAITAVSTDQVITAWNRGAERVFGYSAQEAIGNSLALIVPPDKKEEREELAARIGRGETVGRFETIRVRKGGERFHCALTISPVFDSSGQLVGSSTVAQDISDLKRYADEQDRERRRLGAIIQLQTDIAQAGFDRERVMQVAVDGLRALTGAERAGISQVEGTDIVYRVRSGPLPATTRAPVKGSLSEASLNSGKMLITLSHDDPGVAQVPATERPGSLIIAPLRVSSVVDRVAIVASEREGAFTERDVRTLQLVSGLVGSALEHANEYESNRLLLVERSSALEAVTESQRRLEESEARYRGMIQNASVGVALSSVDGRYLEVNAAYEEMVGYRAEELRGLTFMDLTHPDDLEDDLTLFAEVVAGTRDSYQMEKRYICKSGDVIWVRISISVVRDAEGKVLYDLGVVENITSRKEAEGALIRQSLYDVLTGLPNRSLLVDRVRQAMLTSRRDDSAFALLFCDIDNFRTVNDSFGHEFADAILIEAGKRLEQSLRETDTVARLGGDEFAVLLVGTAEMGASLAAEKIVQALTRPFEIQGQVLELGTHVGIVLYPGHGEDVASLLRRADVAMYAARQRHFDYVLYSTEHEEAGGARLMLAAELRRGIEAGDLVLHYQPQVNLQTGGVSCVEALVRWQHPERGLVPPDQFIALAEQSGLIRLLSLWVVGEALRQCGVWRDEGRPVRVTVNLSPYSLRDEHIASEILEMVRASGVEPSLFGVELTESAVMENRDLAHRLLSQLRDAGVRVSIDDFGTGYSSLAYLKQLPADEIKIDGSFIREIEPGSDDLHIVRTIVELGHSLGLEVVAEGVESHEIAELLAAMRCDFAQGYYKSRPRSAKDIVSLLEQGARHPSLERPTTGSKVRR